MLKLSLDISRLTEVQQPFGLLPAQQTYRLHRADGTTLDLPFPLTQAQLDRLSPLNDVDPNDLQQVGDGLRRFLEPAGWDALEQRLCATLQAGERVFISLRSTAAELLALPWELLVLKSTGQRLGQLPGVLLRYEWAGTSTVPWKGDPTVSGGRILVAYSEAGGAVPSRQHVEELRRACEPLGLAFVEERDVLPRCSLERLRAAMVETPPAVLHLLCHGAPLTSGARAFGLALDADRPGGDASVVDGLTLAASLQPYVGVLRLVVISACDSGNSGSADNWLGSVAQALHRMGLPAVVASRYPLSKQGSLLLTQTLYRHLLAECGSLEESLLAARHALDRGNPQRFFEWASLQLHAREADGEDTRPLAIRPYRGLNSFESRHRIFFNGREELTGRLVKRMEEVLTGPLLRLQAVAGPSGSGKSSLVAAGLIPVLKERGWVHVRLRPEPPASSRLAPELARLRASPDTKVGTALEEARRFFESAPNGRLLVFVDQFEETFTRLDSPKDRRDFMKELWELAGAGLPLVVLLSFRLDFISACRELVHPTTGARLDALLLSGAHTEFVVSPEPGAFPAIIENPARRVGLRFEPGLVDRLVRDTQRAEALPLLEFALEKLWEKRERRTGEWLTNDAYDSLLSREAQGGARDAARQEQDALVRILTHFADELVARLSLEEQEVSRRLFLNLVNPGSHPFEHTRRRMYVDQWRPQEEAEAKVFGQVLEQWVKARLVVVGRDDSGPWAEVGHEALLQHWKTLDDWVGLSRSALETCREVRHHHPTGDWLPARVRRAARRIIEEQPYLLEPELRGYVLDEDRRHTLLSGLMALGVAVLLGAFGYLYWLSRMDAVQDKDRGILSALPRVQQDPTLTALLLKEIHDSSRLTDWTFATFKALEQPLAKTVPAEEFPDWFALNPNSSRLPMRVGDPGTALPRVDGGTLSLAECETVQHIWNVTDQAGVPSALAVACSMGGSGARVGVFQSTDPRSFSFAPADTLVGPDEIVTASASGRLLLGRSVAPEDGGGERLWLVRLRTSGGSIVEPLALQGTPVDTHHAAQDVVAISDSKGRLQFWGETNDQLTRWEVDGGRGTASAVVSGPELEDLAASFGDWGGLGRHGEGIVVWNGNAPDGEAEVLEESENTWDLRLADSYVLAIDENAILVWGGSKEVKKLDHESNVIGLATRATESNFATLTQNGVIRLWAPDVGAKESPTPWNQEELRGCFWPNDGEPLVFEPTDPVLWQRCVEAGQEHARVWRLPYGKGLTSNVLPFQAFSTAADGTVAAVFRDGTGWLWNRGSGTPRQLGGYTGELMELRLSQNGERLMGVTSANWDLSVWTWRTEAPEKASPTEVPGSKLRSWSSSANGEWWAVCMEGKRVTLLHLATARSMTLSIDCQSASLTPDGGWLLVVEWDVDTGYPRNLLGMKAWKTATLMAAGAGAAPDLTNRYIAFSADGRVAASYNPAEGIRVVSPQTPGTFQVLEQSASCEAPASSLIKGLRLSQDGRWIVAARSHNPHEGYELLLWSRDQPGACRKLLTTKPMGWSPLRLDFTSEGRQLLIGSTTATHLVELDSPQWQPRNVGGAYLGLAPGQGWLGEDQVVMRSTPSALTLMGVKTREPRTVRLPFELDDPFEPERDSDGSLFFHDHVERKHISGRWFLAKPTTQGGLWAFPFDSSQDAILRSLLQLGTSSSCLLPSHRVEYLGESKQEAARAYEECRQTLSNESQQDSPRVESLP